MHAQICTKSIQIFHWHWHLWRFQSGNCSSVSGSKMWGSKAKRPPIKWSPKPQDMSGKSKALPQPATSPQKSKMFHDHPHTIMSISNAKYRSSPHTNAVTTVLDYCTLSSERWTSYGRCPKFHRPRSSAPPQGVTKRCPRKGIDPKASATQQPGQAKADHTHHPLVFGQATDWHSQSRPAPELCQQAQSCEAR